MLPWWDRRMCVNVCRFIRWILYDTDYDLLVMISQEKIIRAGNLSLRVFNVLTLLCRRLLSFRYRRPLPFLCRRLLPLSCYNFFCAAFNFKWMLFMIIINFNNFCFWAYLLLSVYFSYDILYSNKIFIQPPVNGNMYRSMEFETGVVLRYLK